MYIFSPQIWTMNILPTDTRLWLTAGGWWRITIIYGRKFLRLTFSMNSCTTILHWLINYPNNRKEMECREQISINNRNVKRSLTSQQQGWEDTQGTADVESKTQSPGLTQKAPCPIPPRFLPLASHFKPLFSIYNTLLLSANEAPLTCNVNPLPKGPKVMK